jgi:hypothetical protein
MTTMKKIILLLGIAISTSSFAQQKNILTVTKLREFIGTKNNMIDPAAIAGINGKTDTDKKLDFKLKGYSIGIGIGANLVLNKNIIESTISPIDQTLKFDKSNKTNLTLTTLFMIPLRGASSIERQAKRNGIIKGKVYQIGDPDVNNKTYVVPYGPYFVVNVNYSDFTKAAEVKPFNQSIDGGIGLGWRFNDLAMATLTMDANKFKQPRNFLKELENQALTNLAGEKINTLDISDINYFKDITAWSLSLKIIFILSQLSEE